MQFRRTLPVFLLVIAACAREAPAPTSPVVPESPSAPGDTAQSATPGASLTYRYGAKFEPPLGRVVHGLGQWHVYNTKYSALLPQAHQPASELIFLNPVDTTRPWNPALIASAFAAIDARGRIPLADITMHRSGQPTPAEQAALPDPLYGNDHEIANSTKWDARLLDLVAVMKAFKKPVLLRIGGEFSGSWSGYHPYEYPKAFRKIVNMFRSVGAENVAFVWCYEPAAPADFDAVNASGAAKWYPGDDYVDWFGIDLFAAADVSGATNGHSGTLTAYGKTLKFLDMAVAARKPVVIAESSPEQYDLSSMGGAAWNEWFTPYFALIASRPEIEWFTYINYDWLQAAYYAQQGWKNNDLSVSAALTQQYAGELAKTKYLHSGERSLLKDYVKYK
jgi:hypothetical protein